MAGPFKFDSASEGPGVWRSQGYMFCIDGKEATLLVLTLPEGDDGPAFTLRFGLLNQCQARLRFRLAHTDLNVWLLPREGAYLKPTCGGQRVDLAKVSTLRLTIGAKGDGPVRWCMTPLRLSTEEPERLAEPLLPKGVLIDELGQWGPTVGYG